MTINGMVPSLSKAARVAGFMLLFAIVMVIVANFGINLRLIVPSNAAETAKYILTHESLFRLGIIAHLFYCICILVLISALYVILKQVNQTVALLATFLRFIYALVLVFIALDFFTALRLIGSADYLNVFEVDRLQALAKLFLSASDAYYVGLMFWSFASTFSSWLWFKSNYVPRAMAVFGVISSAWCVFCAITFLIFPNFDNIIGLWWFDLPILIFELVLGLWLLFKGLCPSGVTQSHITSQEKLKLNCAMVNKVYLLKKTASHPGLLLFSNLQHQSGL